MRLDMDLIRTDGGTQPRAELREEVISDYAELMTAGVTFPPITVFFDGQHYWLADGFHRLQAARKAIPGHLILADLHQGTQADAQWFSYSVNKTHGLRRTNEDKERAVRAALQHPKANNLSNWQVAEHCGVNESTVRRYRQKIESTSAMPKSNRPDETPGANEIGESTSAMPKSDAHHAATDRLRTGRDGRTINTANIGKPHTTKTHSGPSHEVRISPHARPLIRGHSEACPLIALQFSPNNAVTAAATLVRLFPRSFVESLVQELTQRLSPSSQPQGEVG